MKNLRLSQMRRPKHNTLKIMNIEDIKIGETYNVRMKVTYKEKDQVRVENPMLSVYGCEYMIISHKYIHAIHEQPKHDPCREFRKGDKVRMVLRYGRYPHCYRMHELIVPSDSIGTVVRCESNGQVELKYEHGYNPIVHFSFLELVTPVEELEPFYIIDDDADAEHPFFVIQNRKSTLSSGLDEEVMRFLYGQNYTADKDTVRKRAEAERDRLNEEWRKEQKND